MKRLHITAQARADFREIHDYIAKDNIDAASSFIDRLEARCYKLPEMPGVGRKRDDLATGLRSVAEGDYLIFYLVLNDFIEIVHVLHGRRNLQKVFEQE